MCGRFLTPEQSAFERYWGLAAPPDYFQSFNLAPSQLAAVVRLDEDGNREAALFTWGFQPAWAKRGWINARAETVFESKAFAPAAKRRRCLVPALGWYEWQGNRTPKQPYVFHLSGFTPFSFAGIWTARETDEGWRPSFAILTKSAPPPLDTIHSRMPVVLDPEDCDTWLSRDADQSAAEALLQKTAKGIESYAVSRYVNKPANNDAECIRPAAGA